MPNRDLALESYPPHYMTFLKSAALARYEIPMTYNEAVATRARIYKMRKKMETTRHPAWPTVAKVILQIKDLPDKGWCLIGSPNSSELEAFERAGIKPDYDIEDSSLDLDDMLKGME